MRTPQPTPRHRARLTTLALCVLVSAAGCNRETSDEAIARGQAALQNGDYAQAARHLRRAAKHNPNHPVIHFNLGMALLHANNHKAAAKAFEAAEAGSPEDCTEALEALAQTHRLAGDYDAAILALTRAFNKVNRKAHLVAALAVCEMEQGRVESARQLLQDARDTDDSDPVALFNMAVLMQRPAFDNPVKAAENYFAFIINPRSLDHPAERRRAAAALRDIHARRSDSLQLQIDDLLIKSRTARNNATSLTLATEAFRLDPSNPEALLVMIQALKELGRTRQAELLTTYFHTIHD